VEMTIGGLKSGRPIVLDGFPRRQLLKASVILFDFEKSILIEIV
jgi:hypothetical protein